MNSYEKNLAVVGCGYWGPNLVRNFYKFDALHTICDTNKLRLDKLGKIYPDIQKKSRFEQVLANEEIKSVVIATPAALHFSMVKQTLEADKDVFVEKPLSLSIKEGEELVKLAAKNNRILMVGHLLEYHPAVVKLKEIIDSGELGKVRYIYSSRLNLGKFRTEENILWSFAPHDISVILLLLNEMPLHVSAYGGQYLNQDIADVTVTMMSFRGGTKAHIFVSWLHPYKEQKLVIIGSKKMAVFDDIVVDNKLLLYDHDIQHLGRTTVRKKNKAIPIQFVMDEPLGLECQHFLDCIKKRQVPKTDGEKGLDVLRVLDACQRSLQGNGDVVAIHHNNYYVHPSSIVEKPVTIGNGTKIWHFSHIMSDVVIGKSCNIGQNVFIASKVRIGNNVKIQNNVSVYEGLILEDDVFCGPSCVFTNIEVPRSHRSQKGKYLPTLVKRGATIGANATVVCGNTIGKHALVGAGAVVTKDVPDYAMVYGNPAEVRGWICECGTKLDVSNGDVKCSFCGSEFVRQEFEGRTRIERVILVSPNN